MKRIFWLLGSGVFAVSIAVATLVFNVGQSADANSAASCSQDPPTTVRSRFPAAKCTVQFGQPGETWDPGGMGGNGVTRDRNVPSLLYIKSGTTVEFVNAGSPHRISIYNHGIGGFTNFADVTGAVVANVIQPNATPGETLVGPLAAGANTSYKFTEPGQYLVICAFNPHFRNFGQATFIVVDQTVN